MVKKLLLILLLIILPYSALATDYYISSTGSGSSCTSESPCTLATAVASAGDNDTIYFKSDDTWTFETAPFLTAVAGVTYRGNSWPSSSSKAILKSGNGIDADTNALVVINQSNVVFRGFEVDGNSKGRQGGGVYVGYAAAGAINNVTVQECYIHHIGNPTYCGGATSITDPDIAELTCAPNWQYGLYAAGGSDNVTHTNFYILDNEVSYTYHEGIAIYTAWVRTNPKVDGVIVRGNHVHHCGSRPTYTDAVGKRVNGGQGILIANDADNVVVDFNYIHDNGSNNVWFRTSPEATTGAPNGLVIRYNIISYAGASGLTDQNAQNLNIDASIYGNLFYNNGTSATSYGYDINLANDTSTSTINIYNNTIYNTTNVNPFQATVAINPYSGGEARANYVINFKNNIIYTGSSYKPIYDRFGELVASNNLIYRVGGSTLVSVGANNYTSAGIASWDANAQKTDPTFTGGTLPTGFSGTYGTNMVPNTNYFQLTVDSPAKDTGATLAGYTGSINGAGLAVPIVRPLGAAFDIGAYEYGTVVYTGNVWSGVTIKGATCGAAGTTSYCSSSTTCPGNDCAIVCEDFEGSTQCMNGKSSNCRSAWTGTIITSVDFQNATSPAPIEGAYSVLWDAGTLGTLGPAAFSGVDNLYGYFAVNWGTISVADYGLTTIMNLQAGPTPKMYIKLHKYGTGAPYKLSVACASTNVASTATFTPDTGVVYHIFWEYEKAGGTDGATRCKAGIYSDAAKTTLLAEAEDLVGNADATITQFAFEQNDGKVDSGKWDKLKIHTSVIGGQ